MSEVIQYLRESELLRDGAGLTDGQLLGGFIEGQNQAAFAALVRRHGPMVWGVCRRVLADYQDAEDAFQATFLVLVRRAASIRPREMVANWLYGVAHRTALQARRTAARRKARETLVPELPEPAVADPDSWSDLQPLLDQELCRLPDPYRVVLILCDLEGKTRKEVAQQLGLPEGTAGSRLARARALLARRLARRGLSVSGGMLAAFSQKTLAPGVPISVVTATLETASLLTAGQTATAGMVSAKVATLTEGALNTMLLTKFKIAAVLVLLIAVAGVGAGSLLFHARAGEPEKPGVLAQNEDVLQDQRARALIEKQRQVRDSVDVTAKMIEKVLKDVEERTGSKLAALEALEEIDKTTRKLLEQAREKEGEEKKETWTLELRFKNPRLVALKIPEMGEKAVNVWYWRYEVINSTDQARSFVPAFEIVTAEKVYHDEVRPGLTEAIRLVEDPANALNLKNSVTISTVPVPTAAPVRLAINKKGVTGVAFWGYGDQLAPNAKDFTIYVSGLSNAWLSEGDSVRRKMLKVNFKREGNEMILAGPPEWVYRSSRPNPAEENTEKNSPDEIKALIGLLADRIVVLESEQKSWQDERRRLQAQLRAYRYRYENPPNDLKGEDRTAAVRAILNKVHELEGTLTSGEQKEASRQVALDLHRQRLKELQEQFLKKQGKPATEQPTEEIRRKVEIVNLKRSILDLEQQRKAWQNERGRLQAQIEESTRTLQRELQNGDAVDQKWQDLLEQLKKELQALEQPAPQSKPGRQ
jgi:RNA polymerase sigma factor (sigma-70 family)